MTCGELKTLSFNMLDNNLSSFKDYFNNSNLLNYEEGDNFKNSINPISLYKNTKEGVKELNSLGPSYDSTSEVKIRPGAKILKLETNFQYRELIERYLKKNEWDSEVGHSFNSIDFKELSKDYEGIFLSKEVSNIMDNEMFIHSSEDWNKDTCCRSSRVIVLNPDILVDGKQESIDPFREGVSGKLYSLSEYNKTFSHEVFNNIENYTKVVDFLNQEFSDLDKFTFNPEDKAIKKKINYLDNRLEIINKDLNKYAGKLKIEFNGEVGCYACAISKTICISTVEQFEFYNNYMKYNLKYNNPNFFEKASLYMKKDRVLKDMSEAIILHELGHINNNNTKTLIDLDSDINKSIQFNSEDNRYYIDKKIADKYRRDRLHRERLAWDYAFKIKPDCKVMKWTAHYAYSSYVANHLLEKENGYIHFYNEDGERVKAYFK